MKRTDSLSRRGWIKQSATAIGGVAGTGWLRALANDAATHPQRTKSVILLWLSGGPATIDMWDLKPGHENGGPFQEIETATKGVRISEHLSRLAEWTNDMAIVRSITSKEGDHGRATFFARTGYSPQGAIQFPALGALIAHEFPRDDVDLPSFVSIASGRRTSSVGGGFLGPGFSPLLIGEGASSIDELTVPNIQPSPGVSKEAYAQRLALLNDFDEGFQSNRESSVVNAIQASTNRAVRLMRPAAKEAFHLHEEPDPTRDAYGRSVFGQGCLLARRLVERGVSFVEVTLDGWDTHNNNFDRVKGLSGTLDMAFASLLRDLKERGLLESTLVVCQGEFGRTPKINGGNGRDHWPQSWATALAGGGIRGGQAIGRTSDDGMKVTDRPVSVPDVIATVCSAIGIDPRKQNISNVTRPIRIADPSAQPIEELL